MAMEQQSVFSSAEWGEALHQCVATRSLSVLREQVLLVFVEPHAVFHPLHALLPLHDGQQTQTAFVAVMRLHEQVTAVMKELHTVQSIHNSDKADICHAVLENVVFVDRAVDAVSAKRASDAGGRVANAMPFFHPREVNLSGGALCSFAADEASAKAALADITIAVQSLEENDDADFLDAEIPLVVMVEHDEGYIGQTFDGQLVSTIIRVKKTLFKPNDISFDNILEAYEEDFRDQMEISGIADQPQQLAVNVQAGFGISPHHHSNSISSGSQQEAIAATLISSWSGIENIRSLYCKPPPNSSSLVCIGGTSDESDLRLGLSLPRSSSLKLAEPFPVQVRHTIAFLTNLENSIHDSTHEWSSYAQAANSSSEEFDRNYLLRKFRSFLGDPDASQDDTIDLNSTMELNIALNFEREDDFIKNRTDLDFLEKMWEFVLANATSAEAAVALVQEFLVAFATARVIPLVHPANPIRLGEFLKTRIEASRTAGSEGTAGSHQSLQAQLSIPHEALLSLFELGEWKLQRDFASWFTQIGFTAAESALIIDQFQLQEADQSESRKYKHAAVLHLVDVCAMAFSLGMSGSLLRKLANDCLGYFTRQQGHSAGTAAPAFVLPLNSFIPDRIRANLGDALFWDLEISFGELMERKVRICESSFHHKCGAFNGGEDADAESKQSSGSPGFTLALDPKTINQLHHHLPEDMLLHPIVLAFVRNAERNEEDKLPIPVGLVQYECTTRKLVR